MKTLMVVLVPAALGGCSILGGVYDSNEYGSFVKVAQLASQAKSVCVSGDADSIKQTGLQLQQAATYSMLFTQHLPNNNELHSISTSIHDLTKEFVERATGTLSPTYCSIKLDTIFQAAQTGASAAVSKRRQ